MFDLEAWKAVPFPFWAGVVFIFGTMVGSLLNVCIHRMPRGESIVWPPSHCPHCNYSIPWYLNMPIITWLLLRGRCANCRAPISARYFVVELLTGVAFLSCWLFYGRTHPGLALVYCLFLAGLIIATFVDFEHFIIPDEITLGGAAIGFLLSAVVPAMHTNMFSGRIPAPALALKQSFFGIVAGAGIVYSILRLGKLLFGRQRFRFEPGTKIIFSETDLQLPEQTIPYDEIFYRKSDVIMLHAKTIELTDRCYFNTPMRLSPSSLEIGDDKFDPNDVAHLEVVTEEMVVPREAMGLGDVKFMAAIGAFLGWPAVLFSLMASAVIGSIVGLALIAIGRQAWSSRLPYGPYIALAAALWIFGGKEWIATWLSQGLKPGGF